ncbi:MAG: hypothetical protein GX049_06655 [Alcaligenaceae bacterium]|nr:hypothetical protein [Alcaligenaceae bacterium]
MQIPHKAPGGILIKSHDPKNHIEHDLHALLAHCGLNDTHAFRQHPVNGAQDHDVTLYLDPHAFEAWCPGFNTMELHAQNPGGNAHDNHQKLAREVLLCLAAAPEPVVFTSVAALESHVRMRCNVALAASKTLLAFKTEAAERPADFWRDDPENGFVLQPGVSLVDALQAATQPEVTGRVYDFSCYRATEYVVLLGIAQEARAHNPELMERLEQQCRKKVPRAESFQNRYLLEYGTAQHPVPQRYYVPGDRVWFKNPDPVSSDIKGFEGSWIIYMGQGLFSNFWKKDQPYTLEDKCLELYHWRDGVVQNDASALAMDETRVEHEVDQTRKNPDNYARVLDRMMRYRDPEGVYASGGCIDSTREYPRTLLSSA